MWTVVDKRFPVSRQRINGAGACARAATGTANGGPPLTTENADSYAQFAAGKFDIPFLCF
jgi:hypothetical protein